MRKILFIICWALAGVGLYSCSLDEPSYGKTTSDNYYQKESDIEQALTGPCRSTRLVRLYDLHNQW